MTPEQELNQVPALRTSPPPISVKLVIASLIAAIWTTVLLVVIAANTNGLSQVAAGLGGVITILATVISAFQEKLPVPRIKVQNNLIAPVVILVLILDIGGTGAWAGWSLHKANTSIDVTSQVTSNSATDNVLPGQDATFNIPVTAERHSIKVILYVADHDPTLGNCTPATQLSVTAQMAGAPGSTQKTTAGVPVTFSLLPNIQQVRLTVTVINDRDQNCGVHLYVSRAALVND